MWTRSRSPLMAPEDSSGQDWRAALPDDLKAHPAAQKFKTPAEVLKSYVEAEKLIGSSIRPPGPDAAPEAKKEFREKMLKHDPSLVYFPDDAPEEVQAALWKRLGRPEKPEEYAAAEGVDGVDDLRNLAKAAGLTKAQFKALTEVVSQSTAAQKQVVAAEAAALKTEWGTAYEERLLLAKATAMKMGVAEADLAGLSSKQLRAWANAAKAVGTNPLEIARQGDGTPGKLTPAEANAQLSEIMSRPEFFDRHKNPEVHEQLKRKMADLMPMAYPDAVR